MTRPLPGEVWLADLGVTAKTRPVLIVSEDDPSAPRALVTYVPFTTQNRCSRYEISLTAPFLVAESVANVQGISTIDIVRLQRRIGIISRTDLSAVRLTLSSWLGLSK